ncbi:MAG: hypothetical protein IPO21_12045 [Bacteroidales bacterium]|nr:hypothetical protein [Bacteroidales bacterium]
MQLETNKIISQLIKKIDLLVPQYMNNQEDFAISKGVAALCIIDSEGLIYGKVYGEDKIRCRESYRIAWIKASQVWITGYKTNEYEKLVFAEKVNSYQFGINMPDFIGWEGGQPINLQNMKLSVGFSGFRGTSDLEIVSKAVSEINKA